jgi:hypothetical protein
MSNNYQGDQPYYTSGSLPYIDENGNVQQSSLGHMAVPLLNAVSPYTAAEYSNSSNGFYWNLLLGLIPVWCAAFGGPDPFNTPQTPVSPQAQSIAW